MDGDEIGARLRNMPVEASVAFTVRVGLRVLPWLAQNQEKQVLKRWAVKDRASHLLAVFLAYDVALMAVWNRLVVGLEAVAQLRCNDAADAAAAAAAYAACNAAANDSTVYTAYAAASNAHSACAYGNANSFIVEFHSELEFDLDFVQKNGAKALIESPLWRVAIPAPWAKALIHFQTAVGDLNSGFEPWLTWYDERCRGVKVGAEQLEKRVFLPDSILEQSPEQINAYIGSLSQQEEAISPLNRVRTIFIGDGEVGKTSLIRVLSNEAVVEGIEAKTPGIEIREWQVPATQITASFWDFGGQVMVHATHQLFLRESCLYVLLVSAREKEKATERAEYWLEHVKSFGKGAPVLIVANKADKEPVRLDEALLLEKYPSMIKGFFQLACTEAQGRFRNQFEQFKAAFCQHLQAVGLHQVLFEKAHFAVLENLRQRTPHQAFLSHQDYDDVCEENSVAQVGGLDRAWLLDILDKLGVIVHFPDMVGTEEYILNPRWLTYGVYTVMYNENPRMSRQQVTQLLGKNPVKDQYDNLLSYPPAKCSIVVEAMRRYKLCYFLPRDPDQLIIPALLPSDIKQHGFDTANALEFHYQFESFLPRHLISELIVECHEDIQNMNGEDIVWQHGMLLSNKTHGIQALIQADYHFRRLSIWLTAHPAAAEFLAVLRDKVEKIVARIAINYTQNIRLPSAARLDQSALPREPEWANFRQILAQRNKGRTSYDHESGSEYSIAKILGLFEPQPPPNHSIREQIVSKTVTHNVTITNSNITGHVITANAIKDSFNALTDSPAPADLKAALTELLQELERMQTSANAEQTPHVAKAVKSVKRIVEDSSEAEPDTASYKVSWDGLSGALAKLSDFSVKAVELASRVQPFLQFGG
jgi:GTPase SAR1 family protein